MNMKNNRSLPEIISYWSNFKGRSFNLEHYIRVCLAKSKLITNGK